MIFICSVMKYIYLKVPKVINVDNMLSQDQFGIKSNR